MEADQQCFRCVAPSQAVTIIGTASPKLLSVSGGEALTRALDGRQRDAETLCRLPQRGAWVNSLAIAASSQRGRPRVLPFSSARSAKTPTTPAEADHYDALGCVVEAAHLLGRAVADGIFGARVRQRAFRR